MAFQKNQPVELWAEISKLTSALRLPESSSKNDEQEFYLKMFHYISYEQQHKILLLTANHLESSSSLDHCRLILLLLKRSSFPQSANHAPRLLETLIQGVSNNNQQYREMLVTEALPLILQKANDMSVNHLLNRILGICVEYFVQEICSRDDEKNVTDCWRRLFEIMEACGRMLEWEKFLSFNRSFGKDVYWQKLIHIVSSTPPRPSESKQILFLGTVLFIYSLQDYMRNVRIKVNETEMWDFVLLEGLRESTSNSSKRRKSDAFGPEIKVYPPCSADTPNCLITASHCWQLLHSNEILQIDLKQLLINLPITGWITRFLGDLATYLGRADEIQSILNAGPKDSLDRDLKLLSLNILQNNISVHSFNLICSIVAELHALPQGEYLKDTPSNNGRQLVLLPKTRRAILQFCVNLLISILKPKIIKNPTECGDLTIGYLLILLQMNWPHETALAQQVFNIISSRSFFSFLLFPKYMILVDFIEEFMWYSAGGEVQLEFTPPTIQSPGQRRIGTRRSDKGVKDDFKQIMRQQISRSNEDMDALIVQFILQERTQLMQCMFNEK